MPRLPIRIIPDPALREKAAPVKGVDKRVKEIMSNMLETMYVSNGIGLAANQVGILERIIIVDISEERNGTKAFLMANPEILEKSKDTFTYREGCLSIPDQYAEITRPRSIKMRYLDQDGAQKELEAEELLSQCIQHEIDHLNGVLFIDYLSRLKRKMIERKVEKAQEYHDTRKVF